MIPLVYKRVFGEVLIQCRLDGAWLVEAVLPVCQRRMLSDVLDPTLSPESNGTSRRTPQLFDGHLPTARFCRRSTWHSYRGFPRRLAASFAFFLRNREIRCVALYGSMLGIKTVRSAKYSW